MIRILRRFLSNNANKFSLPRAQIDINDIVNRPDAYKKSAGRRQLAGLLGNIDFIVSFRPILIDLTKKINALKKERNYMTLNWKKGHPDVPILKEKLSKIKSELKVLEKEWDELDREIYLKAEALPNLISETAPSDQFKEEIVDELNFELENGKRFEPETFPQYNHKEIGEIFNIFNFKKASMVSGPSWYYLIGDGALLEQALVQYALSKARKRGYKMVIPPSIVKSPVVNACGFKPNDQNNEKQVYELVGEYKSLTGTAEIPLAAYHASTTFPEDTKFPVKYVGVSRSYRAEAGASGKDTKGLYRVHEFTKVELFHFTTPDRSDKELEEIREFQSEMIKELGLVAKVLNMPTSDLGAPAMKKYDIEAWMRGRGAWGELTSCSNCGDYQSRRLNIRYNTPGESRSNFVSTLNGTAMAVPRVIVALVEQYYNPDTEEILIPEVLQPYMDGKTKITPN